VGPFFPDTEVIAKYCDERVYLCLFVCLSVCLSVHSRISETIHQGRMVGFASCKPADALVLLFSAFYLSRFCSYMSSNDVCTWTTLYSRKASNLRTVFV